MNDDKWQNMKLWSFDTIAYKPENFPSSYLAYLDATVADRQQALAKWECQFGPDSAKAIRERCGKDWLEIFEKEPTLEARDFVARVAEISDKRMAIQKELYVGKQEKKFKTEQVNALSPEDLVSVVYGEDDSEEPEPEPQTITGVEAEVFSDMVRRQRAGIDEYGQELAEADLSPKEILQHAYEEALDLAIYLKARLMKEEV